MHMRATGCNHAHHHHHHSHDVTRQPAAQAPVINGETFSYNPQDRMTIETGTIVLPNITYGNRGPEGQNVALFEKLEKVDGKYVYEASDPRQNSALAFSSAVTVVDTFREVFGDDFKWAFKYDKLMVRPNCGKDLNANYKRESGTVNFYSDTDAVRNSLVHSGASADIVAHEVGHALLDAIRPEYFDSFTPESGAFHEAFGDVMSIHFALKDPGVVAQVVKETGGDLSKPNMVAHLAEELGTAINNQKAEKGTGGGYLRNANNDFKWAPPNSLASEKGGPNELGWGKHSFSRVWTGAHFDVLKAMVSERIAGGQSPEQAMTSANDDLFRGFCNMLKQSPRGKMTYKDMAIAFVQGDKMYNEGKNAALIQKCFTDRNILPADMPTEAFDPPAAAPARTADVSRAFAKESLFQSADQAATQEFASVPVTLGDNLGQFAGAVVKVPASNEESLFKSDVLQNEVESDIARLIQAGKIRYNDPSYQMKQEDYYNPKGEPYEGVVVWEDGQMKIERAHISC